MKKAAILIMLVLSIGTVDAQTECGSHDYEQYLENQFPGLKAALDNSRQQAVQDVYKLDKTGNDTVYRIPVVFHVVWNTDIQNIDDSLIYSQLKVLNESYRHSHDDTGTIRDVFKAVAGDTRVEFYLASKDPDGRSTTGINRVKTNRSDFGSSNNLFAESVKSSSSQGVDAWNTERYLNIWVCNFSYRGYQLVSAYAFPPTNAQFWQNTSFTSEDLQGVVINYQFIGVQNPYDQNPSSLRERTLVHEIGHFLGLRHVWADKANTCQGEDDGLSDTPLASSATRTCNTGKNTCYEGSSDKPDMIENYMDYSPYPCTVMFTADQSKLMRYNLINLRPKLARINRDTNYVFPNYTELQLYPNPASKSLSIRFTESGRYYISIRDVLGRVVQKEQLTINAHLEDKFSLYGLVPGMYYVDIVKSGGDRLTKPLLIQ